jgi:hypothetical protein
MTRYLTTFAFTSVLLLWSAVAGASDGQVAFDDRRFNIQGRLGLGTSVGLTGIVGEFDIDDGLNVGAGFGSNIVGPVGEVHLRLRPAVFRTQAGGAAHAVVVELAGSRSRYGGSIDGLVSIGCEGPWDDPRSPCYNPPVVPTWVCWGQLDLGWEFRHRSDFLMRATTRAAVLLTNSEWRCTLRGAAVPCGMKRPSYVLPSTLTLAVGYAF